MQENRNIKNVYSIAHKFIILLDALRKLRLTQTSYERRSIARVVHPYAAALPEARFR